MVLILCKRSANFTIKTRISFDVAKINFLKFSATVNSLFLLSNLDSLVTPSTKSAISTPNFFLTSSKVALVSSMVSCSKAVVMVGPSNFNSAKIFATAIGWLM